MANHLIIAGKGSLPRIVKDHLPGAKVVGYDSYPPDIETDLIVSFGEVGKVLNFAKENNCTKIVFAGAMQKPDLSKLNPDSEGRKLLAKIVAGKLFSFRGDNNILTKVISFVESRGIEVVAAHEIVKDIVAQSGAIGSVQPSEQALEDIKLGMNAAHELGRLDIGQAVVVEDGVVLGMEGVEGTEFLISRAGALKKSYGGVLVKACKPQQDLRVDLPSIGEKTMLQMAAAGVSGVAVEAGKSLLLDKAEMIRFADQAGIFIYGA